MATVKWEAGSIVTLMDTELNSLANNDAEVDGGSYDNANAANLFEAALFELLVTFGSAPTNGAPVRLYLLPSADGTNFGDGSNAPVTNINHYVDSFIVRNVTSQQRIIIGSPGSPRGPILLPPTLFKAMLYNESGQAFPASGSTLKMVPFRRQVV